LYLRRGIVGVALTLLAAGPAAAADRASLTLRGYVPPTAGVTLSVNGPIGLPVTTAAAPAAVTITGNSNSVFQLLLLADQGATMMAPGATMTFDGAPVEFNNGVALLNGMLASNGNGNGQGRSGELLIAMRAFNNGDLTAPLDETYTLVVRAP